MHERECLTEANLVTTHKITGDLIEQFAKLSGDFQPIHLDRGFAAKTRFGKRIAHGALVIGFISAELAKLAGEHRSVIIVSQNFRFLKPVKIGDEIITEAKVISEDPQTRLVTVETNCYNQLRKPVLVGQSVVLFDPYPFPGDIKAV